MVFECKRWWNQCAVQIERLRHRTKDIVITITKFTIWWEEVRRCWASPAAQSLAATCEQRRQTLLSPSLLFSVSIFTSQSSTSNTNKHKEKHTSISTSLSSTSIFNCTLKQVQSRSEEDKLTLTFNSEICLTETGEGAVLWCFSLLT